MASMERALVATIAVVLSAAARVAAADPPGEAEATGDPASQVDINHAIGNEPSVPAESAPSRSAGGIVVRIRAGPVFSSFSMYDEKGSLSGFGSAADVAFGWQTTSGWIVQGELVGEWLVNPDVTEIYTTYPPFPAGGAANLLGGGPGVGYCFSAVGFCVTATAVVARLHVELRGGQSSQSKAATGASLAIEKHWTVSEHVGIGFALRLFGAAVVAGDPPVPYGPAESFLIPPPPPRLAGTVNLAALLSASFR
jgi:hypothetical protein